MNDMEKPAAENEQERLIAAFEQNRCPQCDKEESDEDEEFHDGLCSEECLAEYEKTDPNLKNLTLARGEFDYRYSLQQDAKHLGMDPKEYRKLKDSGLSFEEIREQMETQYKKAA
jgi:hypothetical protein